MTSIGEYSFSDCQELKNISIPDSVETIGTKAFRNCVAAETLFVGSGIKNIGELAFEGCANINNVIFKDKADIQVQFMDNYPWGLPTKSIQTATTTFKTTLGITYQFDDLTGTLDNDKMVELGFKSSATEWSVELTELSIGYGITEVGGDTFLNSRTLTDI